MATMFLFNGDEMRKFYRGPSSGFREDFFLKLTNQKQELPMAAMFVNGSGRNKQAL